VSGLIDHLVVTPEAYHVVDYKTNDITADELPEKAAYYRTQMEAYAVALHQNDPERTVTATLYFTTPDEPHRFEWAPSELATLAAETEAELLDRIDLLE
jgi:ATP-dependent helicase/nuclease subunit A